MSQRFYGSINITDLLEQLNKKHSAFSKADNGKIYGDVTVWLNDNVDKFGNIMTIQLNPKKDLKERDGQPYIANLKEAQKRELSDRDLSGYTVPSDIPVREKTGSGGSDISGPDDLPF